MATAGIFILLLIAFFALHRWYTRPQVGSRRVRASAASAGARRRRSFNSPGDPDPLSDDGGASGGNGSGGGSSGGSGSGGSGSGGSGSGGSGSSSGGSGGSGDGD